MTCQWTCVWRRGGREERREERREGAREGGREGDYSITQVCAHTHTRTHTLFNFDAVIWSFCEPPKPFVACSMLISNLFSPMNSLWLESWWKTIPSSACTCTSLFSSWEGREGAEGGKEESRKEQRRKGGSKKRREGGSESSREGKNLEMEGEREWRW